ncbi:MAG: hypothetical protein ACF8QF_08965 [Phycisphaerales bacterium]
MAKQPDAEFRCARFGSPQDGQAFALLLTLFPHSLHLRNAIVCLFAYSVAARICI